MDKSKNKKGAVPVIAVIVLAIAIAGVVWGVSCRSGQTVSQLPTIGEPEESEQPTPEPELEVNFSEAGNILNWDSRTESYTDEWTLLYEKPGAPALSVELNFNEDSVCDLGTGDEPCDQGQLNNGDRANIEGHRTDGEVAVIRLEKE